MIRGRESKFRPGERTRFGVGEKGEVSKRWWKCCKAEEGKGSASSKGRK
jgi:hypothetical protein